MRRARFILAFLFLLFCLSVPVTAQSTGSKSQPLPNNRTLKEPITSPTVILPVTPEQIAEARKLYDEGLKQIDSGQLPEAAETFKQAIQLNNQYADAYSALGRTYFKMRQWQNAIDNLHRASELNSQQRQAQEALRQKATVQNNQTPKPTELKKTNESQIKSPQTNSKNASSQQPQQQAGPSISKPPDTKQQAANKTVDAIPPRAESTPAPKPENQPESKPTVANVAKRNEAPQINRRVEPPSSSNVPLPNQPLATAEKKPQPPVPSVSPTVSAHANSAAEQQEPIGERVSLNIAPSPQPLETKNPRAVSTKPRNNDGNNDANNDESLTKTYRVGPNDVLDVRLNDSESTKSTLFTITPTGLLELSLLAEPLNVTGLTVEEIAGKVEEDLKKRELIANPKVIVGVRDYASHTILVSGLVKESGTKFLMREAIPLYVVVADAQPLPEAAKVTLVRNEAKQIYEIELSQAADMNLLVRPGDVITFAPNETQFVYIGGEVKTPGEKTFRRGLTLTQAILAAGGATPKSKLAQVGRDDGRGFLVETTFQLQEIRAGKTPDPILKPGDRILILR